MNETNEDESNMLATIQKIGEDFVVVIPNHVCEKLGITNSNMLFKEGSIVVIEPFLCSGEVGIRIKPKT